MTSGSVNVYPVKWEFTNDWDGLTRIVVFKMGDNDEPMPSVTLGKDDVCQIPWEALVEYGREVMIGVYGVAGNKVVLPSVWISIGKILEGVVVSDISPEESKNVIQDIYDRINKLEVATDAETIQLLLNKVNDIQSTMVTLTQFGVLDNKVGSLSSELTDLQAAVDGFESYDDTQIKADISDLQNQIDGLESYDDTDIKADLESVRTNVTTLQTAIENDYWTGSETQKAIDDALEAFEPPQTLTAGDGLEIDEDGNINIDKPVKRIVTETEFDAMTDEEKKGLYVITDDGGSSSGNSGNSRWEVYSEEEIRIGTWIDGKPLYRKVITRTSPENNGLFGVNVLAGAKMVNAWGYMEINESNYNRYFFGYIRSQSDFANADIALIRSGSAETGKIYIYINGSIYQNKPFVIVLEYTKVSD